VTTTKVVFALAEFDPDFTNREILLADKRDGKPLGAKEGPWRIDTDSPRTMMGVLSERDVHRPSRLPQER
jgi:hypothetical protein